MSILCAKYIHVILRSLKFLNRYSTNSSPKSYLSLISVPSLMSELHMVEILVVIHSGAEFLFIFGLVELDSRLSAPKIQWRDRHRVAV